MKEETSVTPVKFAIYALAALVVLLAVAKFGFLDQYARLSKAQAMFNAADAEYLSVQTELAKFPQVEKEYRNYSKSWMNDTGSEDYIGVDRTEVLNMIQSDMMTAGTVTSVDVQDENMVVTMSGMNLSQISAMFSVLDAEPIVKSLELTIAETEDKANASELDFSVTFVLQPAEEAQG
jgi:hypothetical protein